MRDRTLWTWHLFAGAVILVFLGLHMIVMHLGGTFRIFNTPEGVPTDWANVALRMKSMFFAVTYVVLLAAALYHGFYGLRNILFELGPGAALRRLVNVGLSLAGLVLFVFGAWIALAAPGAIARMGG